MARKKQTRRIPNLNVYPLENLTAERILQSETFTELVRLEVSVAIREAMELKKTVATLFQINSSEVYIEIPKSEWPSALESCIEYFSDFENFEVCDDLQKLKVQIVNSEKELV